MEEQDNLSSFKMLTNYMISRTWTKTFASLVQPGP